MSRPGGVQPQSKRQEEGGGQSKEPETGGGKSEQVLLRQGSTDTEALERQAGRRRSEGSRDSVSGKE